jgi:hypothetical protein
MALKQLHEIGDKSIIDIQVHLDTQIIISDNASNSYDNTIILTNDTKNKLVEEAILIEVIQEKDIAET